ncbi:CoA transferase [Williamsia herbipolensis]|uniref:CoA transferase n=1 Tax=Williamsia herbipolensis TaxID=1603258 RepID=A0AAU4JYD1_9NOCA|nr:CaiB/BaiF CoA-transferase family protein [Williamsia herbipolensis]
MIPPLAGVKVVESAPLLAGAAVGMKLADLGADVVKLEPPRGDLLRWVLGQIQPGYSPAHLQMNRNKRSVAIDLFDPSCLRQALDIISAADILIDGNAPRTLARAGLTPEALRCCNPHLIHCRVSGFGATGPYAVIPAHGLHMSAHAGALSVDESAPPAGASVSGRGGDSAAALGGQVALTALAALWARHTRGGGGCVIDAAGADALLSHSVLPVVYAANRHRFGDDVGLPALDGGTAGARYNVYETSDGKAVAFAALDDGQWNTFCSLNALLDPPPDDEALRSVLTRCFRSRTQDEWLDLAIDHRLSIGPAHTEWQQLVDDPQLLHRHVFGEDVHPVAGPFTYLDAAPLIDGVTFPLRRHAPAIGEHNDEFAHGWPTDL